MILPLILIAGCGEGGGSSPSAEEQIEAVFDEYERAARVGDSRRLCETLAPRQVKGDFGGLRRCAAFFAEALESPDAIAEVDTSIGRIEIRDGKADVYLEGGSEVQAVREAGHWYVTIPLDL